MKVKLQENVYSHGKYELLDLVFFNFFSTLMPGTTKKGIFVSTNITKITPLV